MRNVLVVSKCVGKHVEHLAYIRTSWMRDFLLLRIWGDKSDRTYSDLDRLPMLIRTDFRLGVIPIYLAGHPELARYKGLLGFEGAFPTGPVPPDCAPGPHTGLRANAGEVDMEPSPD